MCMVMTMCINKIFKHQYTDLQASIYIIREIQGPSSLHPNRMPNIFQNMVLSERCGKTPGLPILGLSHVVTVPVLCVPLFVGMFAPVCHIYPIEYLNSLAPHREYGYLLSSLLPTG